MKKPLLTLGRVVLTLLVVTFAAVLVWQMVVYYMFAPWTRDGHIRADVIQIAPDVSGLIQKVEVRDNQTVKRGDVLFTIDQDRFTLALRQAKAPWANARKPWPRPHARRSATASWATWWPPSSWKKASPARPEPLGCQRGPGGSRYRPAQPRPFGGAQPGGRLPERPRPA